MANSRIHGLDSARAALLLLGVVFHAAVFSRWGGSGENVEFDWLQAIIHSFRMPAFFAVAGYLMAIAAPRRPHYLRGRMRQLLVPAICTWVFILPIGWLARDGSPLWQPNDISILWFLVALAGASCIVFWADRAGIIGGVLRTIQRAPLAISGIGFFLIVYVTATVAGTVQWRMELGASLWSGILRVVDCTPFLLLGFCASRSDKLKAMLRLGGARWIGPIAFALYAAHLAIDRDFYIGDRSFIDRTASRAIMTTVSISMTVAVLAWSSRLENQHALSARLSAGAFTIYLFHMPVLDVLYAVSRGLNPWVQFLLFVPAATAICYAAHWWMSRSPLLLFMFNGRPFPNRRRSVQPAE